QRARELFGLVSQDLGRPLRDLEMSYRPAELRSMIDRAYESGSPIREQEVEWPTGAGRGRHFDIEVAPLITEDGSRFGVAVTFVDVSDRLFLQRELETSKRE